MMAASASSRKDRSSVLEKVDRRQSVDPTIPLTATILTYKIVQSHVVSVLSHLIVSICSVYTRNM